MAFLVACPLSRVLVETLGLHVRIHVGKPDVVFVKLQGFSEAFGYPVVQLFLDHLVGAFRVPTRHDLPCSRVGNVIY